MTKVNPKILTVDRLCELYYLSKDYRDLREKTQKDYKYCLDILIDTDNFKTKKVLDITTPLCKQAYEQWKERGLSQANKIVAISTVVFSYATEMGYTSINPFKGVKRKSAKVKRIIWEEWEVKKFLDVAYSDFSYRNIGLIVHMAYEWGQRIGDMRLLTWNNIKWEDKQLYLEQSKKRREVFLPIGDDLFSMLQNQKEDFGFQEYVAPQVRPARGVYVPYTLTNVSKYSNCVIKMAGLRQELQLMHLRATAITEMNDAGVPINQIMSVSGHVNPQSVQPYIKHTFKSANFALNQRNSNKTLDKNTKSC